ncbi:MAG: hypothetical protein ACR2I0_03545, partial [Rhodoferax sp.]
MELKHIIARDAKAAADRATALFGRDALIISSHQVGGQTELVVAVDCKEQALAAGARVPQGARAARAPAHAAAAEPAAGGKDFRRDLVRAQEVAPAVAEQRPVGPRQELPGSATTNERDYLRSREIVQAIREEIAALRRDIVLGQKASGWQSGLDLAPEVEALLASFTAAGMPTGLRTLLLH